MATPFVHVYDKPLTYQILKKRLDIVLQREVPSVVAVDLVKACRILEARDHSRHSGSDKILTQTGILKHPNVNKDYSLMVAVLTIKPVPDVVKCFDYYDKLSIQGATLQQLQELQSLMVRKCIYEKEFELAMTAACNEKARNSWVSSLEKKYKQLQVLSLSSLAIFCAVIDLAGIWLVIPAGIYTMGYSWVMAHWISQPMLDRVRWRPQLSAVYKLARGHQIRLIERILVAHSQSNYNVDTYHLGKHLKDNDENEDEGAASAVGASASSGGSVVIQNRNVIPILSQSQVMYNEYWGTAGDNFEWVEPDQDPTDRFITVNRHKN